MAPVNLAPTSHFKRIRLRSDPLPEIKFVTVVRVTIGLNGDIHKKPKKFYASQKHHDVVIWEFTNASGQPIAVTVSDFLRRADCGDDVGTVPVHPFIWLDSDTLTLQDGEQGFIDGRVDPAYGRLNADDDDCLSYSIVVESKDPTNPFETIDYDPDGDIKP